MTADDRTSADPWALDTVHVGDDPTAWARAGLTVAGDTVHLSGLRIRCTPEVGDRGIIGWSLREPDRVDAAGLVATPDAHRWTPPRDVDGLRLLPAMPREPALLPPRATVHRSTAVSVDHLVIGTPDLERTTAAFEGLGWTARRTIRSPWPGDARTMRFFVVPTAGDGATVLEVIQPDTPREPDAPARFWGLALTVTDLDAAVRVLGRDAVSAPKDAVQPGRRIATVHGDRIGLSPAVALMSPRRPPP